MFRWLKYISIALIPIIFLGIVGVFRFTAFDIYIQWIQEDSYFEYLQFVFYLMTALWLGAAGYLSLFHRRSKLAAICLLGAVIITLVAFEEISWGQRIAKIENPTYFTEHNIQSELSVHNLDTIQPFVHGTYMILGLLLAGGRGVLWALSNRIKTVKPFSIFLPEPFLMTYFLPITGVYAVLDFYKPFGIIINGIPAMVFRDQEPVETLLALGLLLHVVRLFQSLKKVDFELTFDVAWWPFAKAKRRAVFKLD